MSFQTQKCGLFTSALLRSISRVSPTYPHYLLDKAWQYPTHSCGHSGERYQAYGKHDGRERQLRAIESQHCPDCRKDEADKAAKESGLPLLTGSPEQIAWASEIRERALRLIGGERAEKLKSEASAKWWIDNRYNLGGN